MIQTGGGRDQRTSTVDRNPSGIGSDSRSRRNSRRWPESGRLGPDVDPRPDDQDLQHRQPIPLSRDDVTLDPPPHGVHGDRIARVNLRAIDLSDRRPIVLTPAADPAQEADDPPSGLDRDDRCSLAPRSNRPEAPDGPEATPLGDGKGEGRRSNVSPSAPAVAGSMTGASISGPSRPIIGGFAGGSEPIGGLISIEGIANGSGVGLAAVGKSGDAIRGPNIVGWTSVGGLIWGIGGS